MRSLRVALLAVLITIVAVFGVYSSGRWPGFNRYQELADAALNADSRNAGMKFKLHTERELLVLDLVEASNVSPADGFRALLTMAEALREESFARVYLARSGDQRFSIAGTYFHELGEERKNGQTPVYLTRTFPEHVAKAPEGSPAFETWTGGFLGVTTRQLEDFNEFSRRWMV